MNKSNSTPVALIPRSILFGNPVKANPQISPDGTMMAYLAPVNDVLNVWVGKIGSDKYQPVTKDEDRGFASTSGRLTTSISLINVSNSFPQRFATE